METEVNVNEPEKPATDMVKKPMKSKTWLGVLIGLMLVIGSGLGVWYWRQAKIDELNTKIGDLNGEISQLNASQISAQNSFEYTSDKGVMIEVYTPLSDETVPNPLQIVGRVPGTWSFEASFPIELLDANGNTLAKEPAQLQGDWTTENLTPFTLFLDDFDQPAGSSGKLILHKDNPSGLAENDDSVTISIKY